MKLELLLKKYKGLIARKGDFKPKVIIPARNFEPDEVGCQDYAMGILRLPQYFWDTSRCISILLKKDKLPELSQIDSLETDCLVAFHRREKFDYYSHYGIVRKRRKRNNNPWLLVIESMPGVYNPVILNCIEELSRYGNYVDIYKKTK